ncbi:hypothetical protein MPTK1_7g07300 [Marchantia polymorpha subsp. ruderalis]|uniref:EF-hand domain-containing protein n=2 Tax=Marchantia polymorpha TaxID=3197 RepID=A0AAF6BX16_MARPO|nr:hypothetical protein MARPO_0076s0064 [Marchantia polymorpha]BBN16550.1 hypothetical protein Mp_7g07300 [Marchantia polymorpha subsp. ruderalis]|eukprot:PTQ34828.1 hypothetical protein MARPO_0076s0064 [Marchantia polymorpha]
MEQLGLTIAECGPFWKDPIHMRSNCVRALRLALRQWSHEVKRMKNVCVELSTAVQNCARLEQSLLHNIDVDIYQSNQDQVASLLGAAESIMAVEEMQNFMAERNRAALDASNLLFGSRGVIKLPEVCAGCQIPRRGNELTKPVVKPMTDGWQPRWPGDLGDPFEPYLQLIEQYLHSAVSFHARALEQLSAAFGHLRKASQTARDVAYLHSLAAAVGLSVKEYQRLLEMFNKIDIEKVGTISKRQLMEAMKRDKDIAAFMQLSRAKNKDGKRETFEGVFNRIDTEGLGAVTWESFLHFFSSERSLTSDSVMNPMCVQPMCTQPLCVQAAMCNQPLCKLP